MDYRQHPAYVEAVRAERHLTGRSSRSVRAVEARGHLVRRTTARGLVRLAERLDDRPVRHAAPPSMYGVR